jgi:MFS family permease
MTGDRAGDALDDVTILTKDYLPPSACAPNDGLDLSSAAGSRKSTPRRCCSNKFHLPMFVTVVCVLFFAESMCSNGLIGATMSTVEKRYGIRSAQSGWIPSSYELTGIPIMVLVGVIGSRVHRPRCMALAGLVSALGALFYTLPHFIAGPHDLHNQGHEQHYCRPDGNVTSTCLHDNSVSTSSQFYLSIFILASMFMSFGAGPMYVMGSAYIDDSASPGQSAFYIGQFIVNLLLFVV